MKKVGIVVDNYKLEKYKKELDKIGFSDLNILPFTKDTTSVTFHVPENKVNDISKLCKRLELGFKRSN